MSTWDRYDSRQVCERNQYGDLEARGRIYRNRWNGGTDYSVIVYGADVNIYGTFRTLADARAYVLAEARR